MKISKKKIRSKHQKIHQQKRVKTKKKSKTQQNKAHKHQKSKIKKIKTKSKSNSTKTRKNKKKVIINQKGGHPILFLDNKTIHSIPLNACLLQYLMNKNDIDTTNGYIKFKTFPNLLVLEKKKTSKISILEQNQQGGTNEKAESRFKTVISGGDNIILTSEENKQNLEKGKYFENVKQVEDSKQIQIKTDISWVKVLCEEIKEFLKSEQNPEYKYCNLKYQDYVITQKLENEKENVVIVGYPNPKTMMSILSQEEFMEENQKISQYHKDNLPKLLAELYNITKEKPEDKIAVLEEQPEDKITKKKPEDKINLENLNDEFYKLIESNFDYDLKNIENILREYKKSENDISRELDTMKIEIKEKLNDNNKLINTFSRPNININYIFFILKENKVENKYEPLIYNIRELNESHKPYLEKIHTLIKTKIPEIFNLLLENETEHDHFNSYCEYGDIFHIETEYIHPVNKMSKFSHQYQRQISLEELIYSSGLKNDNDDSKSFWETVEYEYPIKKYLIGNPVKVSTQTKPQTRPQTKEIMLPMIRYDIDLNNCEVIMCSTLPTYDIEIVYKTDKKFYFMKWKINLWLGIEKSDIFKGIDLFYDCEQKMYTVNHNHSYVINEHYEITPEYEYNIFKKGWSFPIIKHTQVNRTYPYYEYYPILAYNIMNYSNTENKSDSINFNLECQNEICYDLEYSYKFDEIKGSNEKKYTLIVNNFKDKQIVWVFLNKESKEESNIYKNENRIKSVYDFDDPILGENILSELSELKLLNNDRIIICNKYAGGTHMSFHLQILKKEDYQSPLYKLDITQTTESRMINFKNVVNFIKVNKEYYKKINNLLILGNYTPNLLV